MAATGGKYLPRKRFDLTTLQGKQVNYLLDLTWAGQTFHLSRVQLQVPSTVSGESIQYEGTLQSEITWEDTLQLFSDAADVQSVSITAILPVNVPKLIGQGYDLLQALGELSIWIEGTNYEDRRVLLRGRLADPEYGWESEAINASLQSEFFEDRAIIPPVAHVITAESWPTAALIPASLGLPYPFVFGAQVGGVAGVSMSPAYMVDSTAANEILLVAGHVTQAGNVTVYASGGGTSLAVSLGVDSLGRQVSKIGPGLGALAWAAGDDFRVLWNLTNGGAFPNREKTGPLTGAGDVLEYLLGQSTLTIDYGRIAAAKEYLNRFHLAGCILDNVSPFDFVTSNLSPILPMSIVTGPYGLYVIPWRYDATLRDVIDRIDVGIDPGVSLEGPVVYEGSIRDVVNEFKLSYGLRQLDGKMNTFVQLGAERLVTDTTTAQSIYCRQSQARYGKRTDVQESTVIYDTATANLVLSWQARAKCFPTRTVSYSVGWDRTWLERGSVVSITDPDLFFVDQIALVSSVIYREDATILLTLRIVEDVATQFRGVA